MEAALAVIGSMRTLHILDRPEQAHGEAGTIDLIDIHALKGQTYETGKISAVCGEAAFRYITTAICLSPQGAAGAATVPINKEALHLAGHMYSGHTEIFAEYASAKDCAMLLMSGGLRSDQNRACTENASSGR